MVESANISSHTYVAPSTDQNGSVSWVQAHARGGQDRIAARSRTRLCVMRSLIKMLAWSIMSYPHYPFLAHTTYNRNNNTNQIHREEAAHVIKLTNYFFYFYAQRILWWDIRIALKLVTIDIYKQLCNYLIVIYSHGA